MYDIVFVYVTQVFSETRSYFCHTHAPAVTQMMKTKHRLCAFLLIFGGCALFYFTFWSKTLHSPKDTVNQALVADHSQHTSNDSGKGRSVAVNEKTSSDKKNATAERDTSKNSSFISEKLVQAATAIAEKRGLVLFSVLNDAYFDLAASWLCNTAPLGDIHHHVLFLSTDMVTGQRLQNKWPNITVVSMRTSSFSGAQEYSKAGYVRLMVERTRFILHLVQSGLRLLLFEVDFVWLVDPLPTVLSQSNHTKADIVATRIHGLPTMVCGCFLLLNPTQVTIHLWTQLTQKMDKLYEQIAGRSASAGVSEGTNDQTFLSALLHQKYGGVQVAILPEALFPDGRWYTKPELRAAKSAPLIIHNNWVIGNAAKIRRAKKFNHWFLSKDSTKSNIVCNMTAVRDLIPRRSETG